MIRTGQTRIVLIIPGFVAIKFARVRLWFLTRILFKAVFGGRSHRRTIRGLFASWDPEELHTLTSILFEGIVVNWHEYKFYKQQQAGYLMPTHVSLFGLVNFQQPGRDLGYQWEFWVRKVMNKVFAKHPGLYDKIEPAGHTIGSPSNFCLQRNGVVAIVDYGGRQTRAVLLEVGDELLEGINQRIAEINGE